MKVHHVLHIGGYVGEEAPLYKQMGIDFTFVEPVPEYADVIRSNGHKVIEVAVGKVGEIDFYKRKYASSYLYGKKMRGSPLIKVKGVKLSTIQEENHRVYDMLVIDAQGATLDILKSGMLDDFEYIVCEASQKPRYDGEAPMQEIIDYMTSKNFELIYPFKHVGHDIFDLVFIRGE